jgi:hypothetical protein
MDKLRRNDAWYFKTTFWQVHLAAGIIEDQISQCVDLDAFKALFVTPTDADGNPTGNAPIYNWPEAI